ncbi:hypothetical protein HELRODRAFT_161839 [Helobdella robusta]|uniref:Casein kinase substrate phosphoprotein PP28 domain-containing protein n=1 Tax=Helobdella robusta TaxID=6412 RepID=T1ERY7_HELRO|nr:hypothetical protein HELRODRAFT_161839 [Helobdella robusta]ESO02558.1 hypothetical protein HELRODRAFT_161839 [Helobdella robusta]
MPRGKKKSHKGGHRHFTNEDDLALEAERVRKEQEWRSKKGIESDEEGEESGVPSGFTLNQIPNINEDSKESEEESEDDGSEDLDDKPKGVSHLIEVENPNRIKQKPKKVTELVTVKPNLSRKEREELEKQQAKERYQKLHEAGKTEEARADLARLALIRKQREEAAKKREEEKKLAEAKSDKKLKA